MKAKSISSSFKRHVNANLEKVILSGDWIKTSYFGYTMDAASQFRKLRLPEH